MNYEFIGKSVFELIFESLNKYFKCYNSLLTSCLHS